MNEDLTHEQRDRYGAASADTTGAIRRAMTITREELRAFAAEIYDGPAEEYIAAFERIGFIVEPEPIHVPESVFDAALAAYAGRNDDATHERRIMRALHAALREMNVGK